MTEKYSQADVDRVARVLARQKMLSEDILVIDKRNLFALDGAEYVAILPEYSGPLWHKFVQSAYLVLEELSARPIGWKANEAVEEAEKTVHETLEAAQKPYGVIGDPMSTDNPVRVWEPERESYGADPTRQWREAHGLE